jgi:hypothetical protein
MPALTLESALALPQANYRTVEESGIKMEDVIGAPMGALVVTNSTSFKPVAFTKGLATCICIAVENVSNGTVLLSHVPTHYDEALKKIIPQARRSPNEKLEIHMIGGCYDYGSSDDDSYYDLLLKDMTKVIKTINITPNAELKTFDIAKKPHPSSVAFARDNNGILQPIRGSKDYTSLREILGSMGRDENLFRNYDWAGQPKVDLLKHNAENPFDITYDGRLPENQDPAKKRMEQLRTLGSDHPR